MAHGERGARLAIGLSPWRVLVSAAIFIIGYFGVTIVGNALTRYEMTREQDRLRQEIVTLENEQRRLNGLRSFMQTDEFVERSARDLGLVYPGDISVLVIGATPAATPAAQPLGPWWERYFGPSPTPTSPPGVRIEAAPRPASPP